ncbi:MAG: hypothetical protein IT200_18225 [Thermoleophilia bacterium]|nr:hypothetical protein [Thermoleophilia bacterium]
MTDDPREYGESTAWDGTALRTCGWCSFAQSDDPTDPDNHAKWCNDEAWREARRRAAAKTA